jgi:activating signal cointegrator 1
VKALTLHQPWATCIAQHGKRIENRTWAPPPYLIGQRIAIHAGMKLNREVCLRLRDEEGIDLAPASKLPLGAVVSTARVVGWASDQGWAQESTLDFFGVTEQQASDALRSSWWIGPIGWILDHVIAVPPVACKGAQGLWSLPADVERVVCEHEEAARAQMVAEFVEAYS